MMSNGTSLTIGEKLKQARTFKGLSLDNVAHAIKKHKSLISRVESGQVNPTEEVFEGIRKFLELENAPLLPHELELYVDHLLNWEALLDANRLPEARAMQPELAPIMSLPYERELTIRYLMLETRLLFKENNHVEAEKLLTMAEPMLEGASNESIYAYRRNIGFLHTTKGEHKLALKFFLQCLDLIGEEQPDGIIIEQIAHCYCMLNKFHHALRYFLYSQVLFKGDRTNPRAYYVNSHLAACYLNTGEFKKVRPILDILYRQVQISGDVTLQITTLISISGLDIKGGEYDKALKKSNTALELAHELLSKVMPSQIPVAKTIYIFAILHKIDCLKKMGMLSECDKLIEQGRPIAQGDKTLTTILDTAYHSCRLNDIKSVNYLEETAIPYLLSCNGFGKDIVLELCRELEAHYKKKKSKTKAAYMAAIIRDIYEDMFIGDVE